MKAGKRLSPAHAAQWRAAWWLVLALLLVKTAIPQGFMPGHAQGRVITLVLCSAAGPLPHEVAWDAPVPGHDAPAHRQGPHTACPYAFAATPAPPPAPAPAASADYRLAYTLPPAPMHAGHVAAWAGPPLGARAPPRFA